MANSLLGGGAPVEHIADLPNSFGRIHRMRVPGGWIVVSSFAASDRTGITSSMAMAYVPDAQHDWQLGGQHVER